MEQPTSFNELSVLLVVTDGESTRHVIPLIASGHDFTSRRDIPAYDAGVMPYPQCTHEYGVRSKGISG